MATKNQQLRVARQRLADLTTGYGADGLVASLEQTAGGTVWGRMHGGHLTGRAYIPAAAGDTYDVWIESNLLSTTAFPETW